MNSSVTQPRTKSDTDLNDGSTDDPPISHEPTENRVANPFRAQSMRIHPLTRVLFNGDEEQRSPLTIEARIEFLDQFGDTTKARGALQLELVPADSAHSRNAARQANTLIIWEPEFMAIQENVLHFDSVTRTYLLRLDVQGTTNIPTHCMLRASIVTAEGDSLTTESRLTMGSPS